MRRVFWFSFFILIAGMLPGQWQLQQTGIKAEFRGLSAVNDKVAWASGSRNTYARTTDGGNTWEIASVPEKESLDFRDVEAVDADTAYLLSIGNGTKSRIYKTSDGGRHWAAQFVSSDPRVFLDAFAFWDAANGVAVGDPVDGSVMILRTTDGGAKWTRTPAANLPPALGGEGSFAASGTIIAVQGKNNAWFGTGGAVKSRVFRSTDKGLTWAVSDTPVLAGQPSCGIFSIAFKDARNGILVGGDYRRERDAKDNIARSTDGGRTWTLIEGSGIGGFRSCVAYLPGSNGMGLIATGPAGTDYSLDGGMHWAKYDEQGFHVLSLAKPKLAGWAAGAGGRLAKLGPFAGGQSK